MRALRFAAVMLAAVAVGLMAVFVAKLWIPQMGAPAFPLMLAILGGIRLGSYIARDKQSADVDDAVAWALGFVIAGLCSWRSPVGVILPAIAALYAWSTLGMHKRHYPHHWPPVNPMQRHADAVAEQPWKPLLGNVRPAYRNPDNSNR